MSDPTYKEFLDSIVSNLTKNGYPTQKVALPLERMYEVAYEKGLNFNKALTLLEEQGIAHEKSTTRVVFFPKVDPLASMTPDAIAQAQKMMSEMSPDQLQKIMEMVQNLSPQQQAEMMQKAKDMGLA